MLQDAEAFLSDLDAYLLSDDADANAWRQNYAMWHQLIRSKDREDETSALRVLESGYPGPEEDDQMSVMDCPDDMTPFLIFQKTAR